ncbi:MAG: hypothetical protein IKP86_12825 [Anaerolineaceae bacterium]|nr:hypothetical protein [Anaerolineaceae bacterium]
MKSDVIKITNHGEGFEKALNETQKAAAYEELSVKETLQIELLTEEILSTAMIVSGDMEASFWLECEGKKVKLYMTTSSFLDKKKRQQLINASTTRKNEAANSFLGKIRDTIEQALAYEPDGDPIPTDVECDIIGREIQDTEWDEIECSILRKVADDVKVFIRGDRVFMTVSKDFA